MLRDATPRSRLRRLLGGSVLAVALVLPTACGGSQMSPAAVRAANDAVAGEVAGAAPAGGSMGADDAAMTTGGTTGAADSTTGAASTGGTGSTGGGTTPGSTGFSTTGGKSASAGTAGVRAGSCKGFANQTGITDSTITIGNSSDISGPVPGIFASAQQGVKAYVAYFNSIASICGRKLALVTMDSRTDGGADQQSYQSLCSSVFAAVGSMSAFDSGGAATAQHCGLPDLRTASTTVQRNACTTCFAAQGTNASYYENAPVTFFLKRDRAATQHAAIVYLDAAGAAQNAATMRGAFSKVGLKVDYFAGIGIQEFNYGSYVQAMKTKGIRYLIFIGPYQDTVRLQQTMQQNDFKPDVFIQDPTIYDPDYVKQVGAAGNHTYVYMNFLPFEQASGNEEMQTYLRWLQQVAPGASPSFYGVFAWSAAALFVREATQLGGRLTRSTMVAALRGVHNWDAGGMTAPQNVGGKINGSCWRFVQLQGGAWKTLGGYQCDGVSRG